MDDATLRRAEGALVALCVLLCGAMLVSPFVNGVTVVTAGQDFACYVEGFWRVLHGQVPYRDFDTPVGPLYYAALRLTGVLYGRDVDALRYVDVVPGALVGLLGAVVLRPRLPRWATAVLTLMFVAQAVSVMPAYVMIPWSENQPDPVADYNTWSWPLVETFGIALLLRPDERADRRVDAVALACVVAAALLLRPTNVVLLGLYLPVYALWRPDAWERDTVLHHARIAGLAAAALLVLAVGLQVSPLDWLESVRRMSVLTDWNGRFVRAISALWLYGWLTVASLPAVLGSARPGRPLSLLLWLYVPVAILGSLLLHAEVYDYFTIGVLVAVARGGLGWPLAVAGAVVKCGFVLLYTMVPTLWTGGSGGERGPADLHGGAFVSGPTRETSVDRLRTFVGEAREVVGADAERVLVLGFGNPYPAMTGTAPPAGGLAWWDLDRTFGATRFPEPAVVFGSADVVVGFQYEDGQPRADDPRRWFGAQVTALYRGWLDDEFGPPVVVGSRDEELDLVVWSRR